MFSGRGEFVALNPHVAHENAIHDCETYPVLAAVPETYAQNAEDLMVDALLRAIAARGISLENCIYIDIGGNHPIQLSNTYRLYREGMRGLVFEPDREAYREFARVRPEDRVIHAAVSALADATVEFFPAANSQFSSMVCDHGEAFGVDAERTMIENIPAAELAANVPAGKDICLLSVDAEGADFDILRTIDWDRLRPWIVVAEPFGNGTSGVLVPQIGALMRNVGYAFIAMTETNMIFLDKKWLS